MSVRRRTALLGMAAGLGFKAIPAAADGFDVAADVDYPGEISLDVDATDVAHRVLRISQRIPVRPGPLILLYPRWLPGQHGPYGDPSPLAGLALTAGDVRLDWSRDLDNPSAFRVQIPASAKELLVRFDMLTALAERGDARTVMTPSLLNVQWISALLYPAGFASHRIRLRPRLKVPTGWGVGTALQTDGALVDGWQAYKPASLETLVDSPIFAGRHTRRVVLDDAAGRPPVSLFLMADQPALLKASDPQIDRHRQLVVQADRLFGSRHYRRYEFLLAQSETLSGIGLEHHESSENGVRPGYFRDWKPGDDGALGARELLPHEYVHSWNGKYRRPADLTTPHFNTPMRNSLLWVYEGQTQYWGRVLAARSGLSTVVQARELFARAAASAQARVGREWRDLQDTTNEGAMASTRMYRYPSWQRTVGDYYEEGTLVWLEADTLIRQATGGARSLNDFAAAFFGRPHATRADGAIQVRPYALSEVISTLASVHPHDWAGFLRERVNSRSASPWKALESAGWRLGWTDTPSDLVKSIEKDGKREDHLYSLGLALDDRARVADVQWNGPAFETGIAPGMTLIAVDGRAHANGVLAEVIAAHAGSPEPIELVVRDADQVRTVRVPYSGGLRYPRLERIEAVPDLLTPIFTPMT